MVTPASLSLATRIGASSWFFALAWLVSSGTRVHDVLPATFRPSFFAVLSKYCQSMPCRDGSRRTRASCRRSHPTTSRSRPGVAARRTRGVHGRAVVVEAPEVAVRRLAGGFVVFAAARHRGRLRPQWHRPDRAHRLRPDSHERRQHAAEPSRLLHAAALAGRSAPAVPAPTGRSRTTPAPRTRRQLKRVERKGEAFPLEI